jgi:hypothetical protein
MSELKVAMFFYDALKAMMDGKHARRRIWQEGMTITRSYNSYNDVYSFIEHGTSHANKSFTGLLANDIFATDWEVVE